LGSCLPDNASSTRQNRNSAQIRVFSHARLHFVAARVRQPSGGKAPPRKLSARARMPVRLRVMERIACSAVDAGARERHFVGNPRLTFASTLL